MGAGASTVVSPAQHPQQHSTSVVPYVDRDRERDRDRDRDRDRGNMSAPIIYHPVSAPSGSIMNPYDLAPLYAHYARSMLPRRPFGSWGGTGMGAVDWDLVPPMARMMVDLRVRDDGDYYERGRKRSRRDRHGSRDRERDRDRARGRSRHGRSRSRSRHWSRGRSRGGWYSGDEGRSRGRWWSRSRGRDRREKSRYRRKRRGRSENWRKARGEDDDDEEFDDDDFEEDLEYEDMDEEGPMRMRRKSGGRRMLGRNGRGRKAKQKPPRAQDPFLQVRDMGSRNMFRKMSRRMDGINERLVAMEDEFQAAQEVRPRTGRDNTRFPMGYGGRDFGPGDQYDHLGGRDGRRPSGGMGGRRPGMPYRNPPQGPDMGPRDGLDDLGMNMGFGDDDAAQMNSSDQPGPSNRPRPATQNANANHTGQRNGPPNFNDLQENAGPPPSGPSPHQQQPHQPRPTPARSEQEGLGFQHTPSNPRSARNENPPDEPSHFFPQPPPNHEPPPHPYEPMVPPPPAPPGGFRPGPSGPGDYGGQGPQMPPGFDTRRPHPGMGPEGMDTDPGMGYRPGGGMGPGPNPVHMGEFGQHWHGNVEEEDDGPPLD